MQKNVDPTMNRLYLKVDERGQVKLRVESIIENLKKLKHEKLRENVNIVIHYDLDKDKCLQISVIDEKIPIQLAYALLVLNQSFSKQPSIPEILNTLKGEIEKLTRDLSETEKTIAQLENRLLDDFENIPFLQAMLDELLDMSYEIEERKRAIEIAYKLLTFPETAYDHIPARILRSGKNEEALIIQEREIIWLLPFSELRKKLHLLSKSENEEKPS
ncbi:MAG: hypothetical protein ACTSX9_01500 [Candidatus Njordarchaeales archaeon]